MTPLFVAIQASIAEKGGPGRTLKRSVFLTRGSRWRIFALHLVLAALGVGGLMTANLLVSPWERPSAFSEHLWRNLTIAAGPLLASTLHAVVAAVVYRGLVRAKEGIEVGGATQVFEQARPLKPASGI